jgi:hypothetical protein
LIAQAEISRMALRDQVPEKTVEKDYALSWILIGGPPAATLDSQHATSSYGLHPSGINP